LVIETRTVDHEAALEIGSRRVAVAVRQLVDGQLRRSIGRAKTLAGALVGRAVLDREDVGRIVDLRPAFRNGINRPASRTAPQIDPCEDRGFPAMRSPMSGVGLRI